MISSPEQFLLLFPEFSGCDRHQIENALRKAAIECPFSIWREWQQDAVDNLAAHNLAMQYFQVGAIAGAAVESAKGGSPSIPKPNSGAGLSSTSYGQEFIRIREGLPITGMVV